MGSAGTISGRRAAGALFILSVAGTLLAFVFMFAGLRGNITFILELRATQLLVFVQAAIAVGVSTVVFQTITANRILTPAIMGLDALYLLVQATLVLLIGGLGFATLDPRLKFAADLVVMVMLAIALFMPMLRRSLDLGLMLLVGVVLGLLFRSLTGLVLRLVDPNDFAVLQGATFADFNDVPIDLLAIGMMVSLAGSVAAWRSRHVLDVVSLGRDTAISLGIDWSRTIVIWLIVVAVLVAVTTALVGPLAFLGLLVVSLAERVVNSRRHAILLPAAVLTAFVILIGGQLLMKHGLGNAGALSVVIEFAGGLVFLALLFTGRLR